MKKNLILITLFLTRHIIKHIGNVIKMRFLFKLSGAQDHGLRFWQTKSFAIITYATVPVDCIDRVISQNGDRVMFERLATPRPAPKVTLESKWRDVTAKERDVVRRYNEWKGSVAGLGGLSGHVGVLPFSFCCSVYTLCHFGMSVSFQTFLCV